MHDDPAVSRPTRPTWSDALIAVLVVVPSLLAAAGMSPAAVLVATAQVAPLPWRRVRPLLVFGVIAVATLAQVPFSDNVMLSNLALMLSVYAVVAWDGRPRAIAATLAVCVVGAAVAGVRWGLLVADGRQWRGFVIAFVVCLVTVAAFAAAGEATRRRRQLMTQLHARAVDAERERDQHARLAAQSERTRIAREMHDVVAHALAVIVVQADGAAYAVRHSGSTTVAVDALDTIGSTSRDALAETRRLVGVLRQDGDELELAPAVAPNDVATLVDRVRDAGLDVRLSGLGALDGAPREVVAAVHRVVQEALTNVIKHAGADPRTQVVMRRERGDLIVRVTDDGRGPDPSADDLGHGLLGMRERVHVLGGALSTEGRPGGGYQVTARIPLGESDHGHEQEER